MSNVYEVSSLGWIDIYFRENYVLIVKDKKFTYMDYDFNVIEPSTLDPLHNAYKNTGKYDSGYYGNTEAFGPFCKENPCEGYSRIREEEQVENFLNKKGAKFVCNGFDFIANTFDGEDSLYCPGRNYSYVIDGKHVLTFNDYDQVILVKKL